MTGRTDPETEAELQEAEENAYVSWILGDYLDTLDLRAAQHAAANAGEHADAEKLSREIADREAVDR